MDVEYVQSLVREIFKNVSSTTLPRYWYLAGGSYDDTRWHTRNVCEHSKPSEDYLAAVSEPLLVQYTYYFQPHGNGRLYGYRDGCTMAFRVF